MAVKRSVIVELMNDAGQLKPLAVLQREIMNVALAQTAGNVIEAAKALGVNRETVRRMRGRVMLYDPHRDERRAQAEEAIRTLGTKDAAARSLQVSRNTLNKMLK